MSKIGLCFLTLGNLPLEAKWNHWFSEIDDMENKFEIMIHSANNFRPIFPMRFPKYIKITTVPTKWDHTSNAHRAFILKAKELNLERIILISESCIPVKSGNEIYAMFQDNYATWLTGGPIKESEFKNSPWNYRIIGEPHVKYFQHHEQWFSMHQRHYDYFQDLSCLDSFKRCFADNEHFVGTIINYHEGLNNIEWKTITYTNWNKGGKHPQKFDSVGLEEWHKILDTNAMFMRKIHIGTRFSPEILKQCPWLIHNEPWQNYIK